MRPDVAAYRWPCQTDRVPDFAMIDMWIEIKPKGRDPFLAKPSAPPSNRKAKASRHPRFLRSSMEARHIQGQLVAYANAVFCRQFRTRLFTVLISGHHARIMLWDKSYAIVTDCFDITSEPRLLAEFFWRYHLLPMEMRGYDTSVTTPSADERALANRALRVRTANATFVKLCVPDDTGAAPSSGKMF